MKIRPNPFFPQTIKELSNALGVYWRELSLMFSTLSDEIEEVGNRHRNGQNNCMECLDGCIDTEGNVIIDDSDSGLVLKSPDGTYWQVTVDNTGTLSVADVGTTKYCVFPADCVTISSATTESSTLILVTFSEGVQIDTVTGWTFTLNGSPWTVSSVASTEDPTQWEFTMGSAAASGNTLTIEYDGAGDMTDVEAVAACAIAETGISNTL